MKKVKEITVRRHVDVSANSEVSRKKIWNGNYQDSRTENICDYDYANIS